MKRRSSIRTAGENDTGAQEPGQAAAKRERTDPNVTLIQYHDVTAASFRIRKGVKETPLKVYNATTVLPPLGAYNNKIATFIRQKSEPLSEMLGMNVFFKKEFMLPTGRY